MLKSGTLRHRITVQKKVSKLDDIGRKKYVWEDIAVRIAAHVSPASVREFVNGNSEVGSYDARVVVRYNRNYDHTCRIIFRDTVYNILGCLPDNVSGLEYMTLAVKAGENNG